MTILITGSAGFIGFHVSKALLKNKKRVIGIDNINNYYDTKIKKDRLKNLQIEGRKNFTFYKIDISNYKNLENIFKKEKIKYVINLAAQAGVRYSISNPDKYISSNIVGFFNVIELSKKYKIKHLVYASTSSVYGDRYNLPLKEFYPATNPIQLYAATKRSNELIAHSYSHLFNLPTTGIRFFTVYGPWGRPDMALFKFTKSILNNKKIEVFNYGKHSRDFTYIDDIVKGILLILNKIPKKNNASYNKRETLSTAAFDIYNIGNSKRVNLKNYIKEIEKNLNIKSKKKYLKLQPGDIKDTLSSTIKLNKATGYKANVDFKEGVKRFINWYLSYYKVKP